MAANFTYSVQMAGDAFDHVEEKGSINYAQFRQEFRSFPWKNQVGRSEGGSEATISVRNNEDGTVYWVSVVGEPSEYAYLVGIVYPKKVRRLLGLGKEETRRWLEIHIAETGELVEDTFALFFAGSLDQLKVALSRLPKVDEMESVK